MSRILIAPDSFKGSLSAITFCRICQQVIQEYWPSTQVITRPLSDGGEGFIDAFCYANLAEKIQVDTLDPIGRKITASYGWQAENQTAIIEMAQASGLPLLTKSEQNPLTASTWGTGLIIKAAIERGAKKIILGLGGSATNDAGAGALQALGIALLNNAGHPIAQGGSALNNLAMIGDIPAALLNIEWLLACDVTNPLTGPDGATAIFGPQKGLQPDQFEVLEKGLTQFATIIKQHMGTSIISRAGAGAAGGMAGGFIGLLNAKTQSGFDLIAEATGLTTLFTKPDQPIDLVITGEGKLDMQTCQGKLPSRIASLAKDYQVPTIALCGQIDVNPQEVDEFLAIFSLVPSLVEESTALEKAPQWLAQRLLSTLKLFYSVNSITHND